MPLRTAAPAAARPPAPAASARARPVALPPRADGPRPHDDHRQLGLVHNVLHRCPRSTRGPRLYRRARLTQPSICCRYCADEREPVPQCAPLSRLSGAAGPLGAPETPRPTPSGSPAWPSRCGSGCCTRSPSPARGAVGELTEQLGISQSTCSHHLRKLADVGFVPLRKAAPPPWSRSTPAAAPGCRTPPTPSWACSPPPVLPDRPARRRHRPRARPPRLGRRAADLRRGHRHRRRHLRDHGPRPPRTRPPLAARAPLGRRTRRAVVGWTAFAPGLRRAPSTPASARPRSTSTTATAAAAWVKRSSTAR